MSPPPEPPLLDRLNGAAFSAVPTRFEEDFAHGVHCHPHGELFLLYAGYMKSESSSGRWVIPPSHLCWIPPLMIHGADINEINGTRIHVCAALTAALPGYPLVVRCSALILAVVERLTQDDTSPRELTEPEQRLLSVLLDEIEVQTIKPIVLPMPKDTRLKRIAELLIKCPSDPASVEMLADNAGMSVRNFTRCFKLETGLSFGEWRQIARLMQGIELLAAGKSVTETSFSLGYDSISSFVSLCQRHTGMSPKALAQAVTGVDS